MGEVTTSANPGRTQIDEITMGAIGLANADLARAYLRDVFNAHDPDRCPEYLAADVTWHGGTLGTVNGLAEVTKVVRGFVTAFPDLRADACDVVADEDTAVVRSVVRGTHRGELLGIPPTGHSVRWDAVDIYRIADGRITEIWARDDLVAILHQLGEYSAPWLR